MIVCGVLLLIVVGGCPVGEIKYADDLVGGYVVWATDAIDEAAIFLKDTNGRGGIEIVPATVFAYGWNDDFIIAKQRVSDHRRVGPNAIRWYLIQVQNRHVHGPLTEDEFVGLCGELQVPSELSFTKTIPDRKSGDTIRNSEVLLSP